MELLANGGVAEVGEAEPPHGDPDANLTGEWKGDLVVAAVARPGDPQPEGSVIGTRTVAGVRVDTVQGSDSFLRFEHGGFVVHLQVLGRSGRFLREASHLLVGTILCPSECGDLPEGADG